MKIKKHTLSVCKSGKLRYLMNVSLCHGRRRYAFPIRLSGGDDVKVGPRGDEEVCLSYIYSYD